MEKTCDATLICGRPERRIQRNETKMREESDWREFGARSASSSHTAWGRRAWKAWSAWACWRSGRPQNRCACSVRRPDELQKWPCRPRTRSGGASGRLGVGCSRSPLCASQDSLHDQLHLNSRHWTAPSLSRILPGRSRCVAIVVERQFSSLASRLLRLLRRLPTSRRGPFLWLFRAAEPPQPRPISLTNKTIRQDRRLACPLGTTVPN